MDRIDEERLRRTKDDNLKCKKNYLGSQIQSRYLLILNTFWEFITLLKMIISNSIKFDRVDRFISELKEIKEVYGEELP